MEEELQRVGELIRKDQLPDVSLSGGELHITPLKKTVPDGVEDLTRRAYDLLPRIKLTDLLVEVDGWPRFIRHFTHLHTGTEAKDKTVLYAAILADGINLGLVKMAEACPGITFDQLAWVSDWYIRDDTYSKALAEIVDSTISSRSLPIGVTGPPPPPLTANTLGPAPSPDLWRR